MTRWFIAAAFVIAAIAGIRAQEPDLTKAARIPMAEFKSLYAARKVLVVDVRDDVSFATGHIPGAMSMPLGTLLDPRSIAELKAAKKPIVLYCA